MSLLSYEEFLKPISEQSPAGEDCIYDDDFALIKKKRIQPEERSLGAWKEKKNPDNLSAQEKKSIFELCANILKNKGKSLQVVAFLLEETVKKQNIPALLESLEFLRLLLENYWESLYPLQNEEEGYENRAQIFLWIDEKVTHSLRFSPILVDQVKEEISFDDVEKVNNLGIYGKSIKANVNSSTQTKYQLFLRKITEQIISENILDPIDICFEKINEIRKFIAAKDPSLDRDFFASMSLLLGSMKHYFQGIFRSTKKKEYSEENSAMDEILENNPGRSSFSRCNGSQTRDAIYEEIENLAKQLIVIEPHSPVPQFIFKVLSWKNKSFLEIVAEMGGSSPLFEFMNQVSIADGERESQSDGRRMRYED